MVNLLEAVEENLHGHVAFVQSRVAGMIADDRDDLLLVDSGLATDAFNKILRARLNESTVDQRIDEAIGHFHSTGRPFAWWIGPCSRPLDLEQRLKNHGLHAMEFERGMTMDLSELNDRIQMPAGLEVRRVATSEALTDFSVVVAGDPPDQAIASFFHRASAIVLNPDCPMQFFVGYMDGIPAASAELFLGGGLAGIHMVSTREQFQRRGIGLAMTWAAAHEGRKRGAAMAALQASEQGRGVYARLGFADCCGFVEYR